MHTSRTRKQQQIYNYQEHYPEHNPKNPIEFSKNGLNPIWITGKHKALNNRGNNIQKSKSIKK